MSNHDLLRRGASPKEALEALGDSGAPGGLAELEKNLIDRNLLLPAEREAHKPNGTGRLLAPRPGQDDEVFYFDRRFQPG
jgi:hypothetical protein